MLDQENSFGTPCIYFYELFIISLSLLPLCWTQTRNWQSQNVASVLATLWGCSLIDTVLFTLEVAVNTDSRRCHTHYKISGQRPERCQLLCYKPRSTSFTTQIQTQCCKLRYTYFIIRGGWGCWKWKVKRSPFYWKQSPKCDLYVKVFYLPNNKQKIFFKIILKFPLTIWRLTATIWVVPHS